jgi:hypothetical protein
VETAPRPGWNDGLCHDNGLSTDHAVSGAHSHRSEITCAIEMSHRGYGGVQFSGDTPLPVYTNAGAGIEAPHGVVNTYWSWLDVPYTFGGGRWPCPCAARRRPAEPRHARPFSARVLYRSGADEVESSA